MKLLKLRHPTEPSQPYGKKPSYEIAVYFNHLPDRLRREPTETVKTELAK